MSEVTREGFFFLFGKCKTQLTFSSTIGNFFWYKASM